MRLFLILALCMGLMTTHQPVRADEPGDSIEAVIEDQLAAFQRNDMGQAFRHAAPLIQEKFGTPQNFGRMVELAYPMVWRPRRHEMRQLVETESGPVQVVLFEDGAGRLHEAGYLMQMIDGVWRIAGVKLRQLPSTGV